MQAIDALLPGNDGVKWFNRLYLMVTEQVDQNPPGGAWHRVRHQHPSPRDGGYLGDSPAHGAGAHHANGRAN